MTCKHGWLLGHDQERLTFEEINQQRRRRMHKKGLAARRNEDVQTNIPSKLDLPREVVAVIWYIQEEFQKPIWLLGLTGLYFLGVPFYRSPEVISIYSPISKAERSDLDDYLRDKYKKIVGRRSDRGTFYSFPHGCMLDVNRADQYVETYCDSSAEGLEQNRLEITKDVYIQVPRIEDLVIMKLMLGRTKDLRDVRHVLWTSRSLIDMNMLEKRAREAGVEFKLRRLQRIV